MWWNDTYQPEYLFNNHEAYIGETIPEVFVGFLSCWKHVLLGAGFMAFMMYYYNMGYMSNYTYTKVLHQDYYENSTRMAKEKIGLNKDIQGSRKTAFLKINSNP
jgi:hypothetical protein